MQFREKKITLALQKNRPIDYLEACVWENDSCMKIGKYIYIYQITPMFLERQEYQQILANILYRQLYVQCSQFMNGPTKLNITPRYLPMNFFREFIFDFFLLQANHHQGALENFQIVSQLMSRIIQFIVTSETWNVMKS